MGGLNVDPDFIMDTTPFGNAGTGGGGLTSVGRAPFKKSCERVLDRSRKPFVDKRRSTLRNVFPLVEPLGLGVAGDGRRSMIATVRRVQLVDL